MGKHRKHYRRSYNSSGLTKKQKEAIIWSAVTVILIWLFLWLLFWLGIVLLVAGLLYLVHFLNKNFGWYNTKYFYAPILSFSIAILLIVSGGFQVLYSLGKIDDTFWAWAKEGSNYVGVKYTRGQIKAEPNIEDIAENAMSVTSTPVTDASLNESNDTGILGWLGNFVRLVFGGLLSLFSTNK